VYSAGTGPKHGSVVGGVIIRLSAFTPKLISKQRLIERDSVLTLALAEKERVSRIVDVSGYDVREDLASELDFPIGRIKLDVEKALCRSQFDWTVLGSAPSIEIFFAMTKGNRMMVPGGGPPALPTVSPVDVGEIAAQAVLRDGLQAQRIRLLSPQPQSENLLRKDRAATVHRTMKTAKQSQKWGETQGETAPAQAEQNRAQTPAASARLSKHGL